MRYFTYVNYPLFRADELSIVDCADKSWGPDRGNDPNPSVHRLLLAQTITRRPGQRIEMNSRHALRSMVLSFLSSVSFRAVGKSGGPSASCEFYAQDGASVAYRVGVE